MVEIWRTHYSEAGFLHSKTRVTGRVTFEISAVYVLTTFVRVKIFPNLSICHFVRLNPCITTYFNVIFLYCSFVFLAIRWKTDLPSIHISLVIKSGGLNLNREPLSALAMTTFAQPKTKLRMITATSYPGYEVVITAEDKMNKLKFSTTSWPLSSSDALNFQKTRGRPRGYLHSRLRNMGSTICSIRIRSIPKVIRRCSMVTIQNGGIIVGFCHSCLGNFAHCNDNIFCWNNPALSFYSSTVQ